MKGKFRRRKIILACVSVITVIAVGLYLYFGVPATGENANMPVVEFVRDFFGMAVSALISTFIAIWLTHNDILEDDFTHKKEEFGVITFEKGYKRFFTNGDSKSYLNINDWEEFWTKENEEKEIDIVGVALKGYFDDENSMLPEKLLKLCLEKGYQVRIILGNPFGDEVKIQAKGQRKNEVNHIAKSICTTYEIFKMTIEELDVQFAKKLLSYQEAPSKMLVGKFKIMFCDSMPKAFIVRAGAYMSVTPYQMHKEGPSVAPTLIVKDAGSVAFYDQYKRYINRLEEMSHSYENMQKHIPTKSFFTQPYGNNLSEEFRQDLLSCQTLYILGLGQHKMITALEYEFIEIAKRNGRIVAIMAKPDGESTKMCVNRSIVHSNLDEAILEHKKAINKLINIRDSSASDKENIKVYTWDCFFPYTMYAFNIDDPQKAKIYIWITNLFAKSNERDGFVIDGRFEPEQIEKYKKQYEEVMKAAKDSNGEIITQFSLPPA